MVAPIVCSLLDVGVRRAVHQGQCGQWRQGQSVAPGTGQLSFKAQVAGGVDQIGGIQ